MAHFNFVISQHAKWGHAGFYIDCHRMTVPENIFFTKSTDKLYKVYAVEVYLKYSICMVTNTSRYFEAEL